MSELNLSVSAKDVTGKAILRQAWFDGGSEDYKVDACIGITGAPTIIVSVGLPNENLETTYQIEMPQIIEQLIENLKTQKEQNHE